MFKENQTIKMQFYFIYFFLTLLNCGVHKEVKKQGLAFFTREQTLYFAYPWNTQITGISCVDITPDHLSTATIEEGGIGHGYVKIHLQSARGYGLKYIVEIYSKSLEINQEARETKQVQFVP